MPRDLSDIPDSRGRKRNTFFTPVKIVGVGVFLIGLLVGIYMGIEFFQPVMVSNLNEDLNNLQKVNNGLDERLDNVLTCLSEMKIDPDTCDNVGEN